MPNIAAVIGLVVSLSTKLPSLVADGEALVSAIKSKGPDVEASIKADLLALAKLITDFANSLGG